MKEEDFYFYFILFFFGFEFVGRPKISKEIIN